MKYPTPPDCHTRIPTSMVSGLVVRDAQSGTRNPYPTDAIMMIDCVTHGMGIARTVAERVILMAGDRNVEEVTRPPPQMINDSQHETTREFMKVVNS